MRITIQAKTKAKVTKVEEIDETHFKVWVRESPQEGKANMAIRKVLSKHFSVPQSSVQIISGTTSRIKIVDLHNV